MKEQEAVRQKKLEEENKRLAGAGIQKQVGAEWVMDQFGESFCRLKVIFGDSAYGRAGLPDWVPNTFGWILQTVLAPVGVEGFCVLPKRWIVERPLHGWPAIGDTVKITKKLLSPASQSPISQLSVSCQKDWPRLNNEFHKKTF